MNTTLTPTENHIAQTKPWKRKYQAYDLDKDRTIYFENPHGKAAKRLYKQYIDYGFEPEMVVPDDLQYYPLSGRFIKQDGTFFLPSSRRLCRSEQTIHQDTRILLQTPTTRAIPL